MKITALHILSILFFLQLTPSCKKEKALPPNPSPPKLTVKTNNNFSEIWSNKISEGFYGIGTVVSDSNVVYWYDIVGGGYRDDMVAFNKRTGDTAWHKIGEGFSSKHKLIGNYIYFSQKNKLLCINPKNGNELWRLNKGSLADFLHINGSIYAFFETKDSAVLYKVNPISGANTHIYSIYTADRGGFIQEPSGIIHWKHPNGNDIIFVQSSALKVSVGRGEYYAIDITADSMYWDLGEYFTGSGGIGFFPILDGNNVVINNLGTASLNLINKTLNWNTTEPISVQTYGQYAVISNNKIFKDVGNFGYLNIIDANNGNHLKSHTDIGTNFISSKLVLYNNKVYFTTSSVIGVIDCISNNFLNKIKPDETIGKTKGAAGKGLAVDSSTGYIYTTRGTSFVCIKEK